MFTPADLAQKAQDIAHGGLSKRLVEIYRESWGPNWFERLNKEIDQVNADRRVENPSWRGRPHVRIVNGEPDWDFSNMLYALIDGAHVIPRLKANKGLIKGIAYKLRDGRNDLAHKKAGFDPNNRGFAEAHMKNAVQLMKLIDGRDRVNQIEELLGLLKQGPTEGPSTTRATTEAQTGVDRAELSQIRTMLEELLKRASEDKQEKAAAASASDRNEEPAVTAAAPPVENAAATSPSKASVLGRRRNAIPPPSDGIVLFPVVSPQLEYANDIGCVRCTTYTPASRTDNLSLAPTLLGPGRANLYYQIIQDARASEHDAASALKHTYARIDPNDFGGASFGLAAAIADRSARSGFTGELAGRQIVATGAIEPGGQGSVGPIDGFEAKVRLLEREAAPGAMFIFPLANLERADAETRQRLERAAASGRLSWKAITHIQELEAFFGAPQVAPKASLQEHSASAAADAGPSQRRTPAQNWSAMVRSASLPAIHGGWGKLAATGAAIGAIGLAAVMLFAEFSARTRLDPALVQASDERLLKLSRLGASVGAVPIDAPTCRGLLSATSDLTSVDRDRMLAAHRDALAAADRCSTALRESDRRWDTFLREAGALEVRKDAPPDGLAEARRSLTTFDLSRQSEANLRLQLPRGDEAVGIVEKSDSRWAAVATALAKWRDDQSASALDAVVAAWANLSTSDLQRIAGERAQIAATARGLVSDWKASESRLAHLMSAVGALRTDNSPSTREGAESALAAITSFDRSRATSAQSAAIGDAQRLPALGRLSELDRAAAAYGRSRGVEEASSLSRAVSALKPGDEQFMSDTQREARRTAQALDLEFLNSDSRLRELVSSHKLAEVAETTSRNIAASYAQLISSASKIVAWDRSRMNAEQRAAFVRSDQIRAELVASDRRIAEAVRWAEIGLTNRSSGGVGEQIQKTRNALTRLDHERLSSEQRSLLDRVCGISPAVPPGTLAPLDLCTPLGVVITAPVLQPIIPAR